MKTKRWMYLAAAAAICISWSSCQDWGEVDPIAGQQVNPSLQNVSEFAFDDPEMDLSSFKAYANPGGQYPAIVEDEVKGNVLSLNNGYLTMRNPLNDVTVQNAVSMTFWLKQPTATVDEEGNETSIPQDVAGTLIGFSNDNATSTFRFTANGMVAYNAPDGEWADNDVATDLTGHIAPNKWQYIALIMSNDGYELYVDGQTKVKKDVTDFDCSKVVRLMNEVSTLYISDENNASAWLMDDFKLYRNKITSKEIARPKLPGESSGGGGGSTGGGFVPLPDPIYSVDFEYGLNGCSIKGNGSIIDEGGTWGKVFQNVGGEVRQNFLILPEDCMMRTGETQEMTVSFWVNAKNAGEPSSYMWSPIFTAYSEYCPDGNHAPMFVTYYRGGIANNMNGADNVGGNWCDYTNEQCDQGAVTVRHNENDWLADHDWHMYTVVVTRTSAAQYFDNELVNSWTIDGSSDGQRCEIFGSSDLRYICLGGNQSWWWDPDFGAAFDDVKIYNKALSQDQVNTLYDLKGVLPQPIYSNDFEYGNGGCTIQGKGTVTSEGGNWSNVFQNVGGEVRQNFLILPEDCMMRTGETQEMTVSFWVNAKNAGEPSSYMWSPIFTAYSEYCPNGNHAPMFVTYYRGGIANNMNGADNVGGNWCDYTNEQCDQGAVTVRHNDDDWLADHNWHMYTVTVTRTSAAQYFDDELVNSWTIDGSSDGQRCEIFGSSDLRFICLGGNQSWWWDPDFGAAFDGFKLYNKALTQEQISTLMQLK